MMACSLILLGATTGFHMPAVRPYSLPGQRPALSAQMMAGMPLPAGSLVALVTPMKDDGTVDIPCLRKLLQWHVSEGTNGIVVLGTTGEASKAYVNALFTCNHAKLGSLHTNLGALDVSNSQRIGTWGLAWERAYGDVTAHVEVYGQQHDKPTWATGLRTNILPKLQLDGSIGRQGGHNLLTLGTKWMF